MDNLERETASRVYKMMGELMVLVGESLSMPPPPHGVKASGHKSSRPAAGSNPGKKRRKQPAARRSTDELLELEQQLYASIESNPGDMMQMYSRALNCPAADLAVPMRQLLKSGRVRKTGERNLTRYHVVS